MHTNEIIIDFRNQKESVKKPIKLGTINTIMNYHYPSISYGSSWSSEEAASKARETLSKKYNGKR